ncbi:MAG: hypothetical protein ACRCZF_13330, partial [Gemmataceae bacterium]
MTLPLLKNRPTTPVAITRSRIQTKLALAIATAGGLWLFGPVAPAQSPTPPGSEFVAPLPIVEAKPLPQLTPLTAPPAPVVIPPGQTMTLEKPAGESQPGVPAIPTLRPFPGQVQAVPAVQQKPEKLPEAATEQAPEKPMAKGSDRLPALPATTGSPTRGDVFRMDDDAALEKRILRELGNKTESFPPIAKVTPPGTVYVPKTGESPPSHIKLEPNYIVHRRLYFEEKNSERYGWDVGPAQPVFSAVYFYKD